MRRIYLTFFFFFLPHSIHLYIGSNPKQSITDAIATIDEDMLQRTWQEIEYRLDVLHTAAW